MWKINYLFKQKYMNIKKITVKSGGLRGLEVEYTVWDKTKDGKPTRKTMVEKKQIPVHVGLEKLIKSLRVNLLEINRIVGHNSAEDDVKYIVQECDITKIEYDQEHFVLGGDLMVLDGKYVKIKTPKVQAEDGYVKYQEVMDIILSVITETKEYLSGTNVMSSDDIVLRWIQAGKAGVSEGDFDKLTDEEKKQFCMEFLEKQYGAMIMLNDDVEILEDDGNDDVITIDSSISSIAIPTKQSKKFADLTVEDKDWVDASLTKEEEF